MSGSDPSFFFLPLGDAVLLDSRMGGCTVSFGWEEDSLSELSLVVLRSPDVFRAVVSLLIRRACDFCDCAVAAGRLIASSIKGDKISCSA